MTPALVVEDLTVEYATAQGPVLALDGTTFTVESGACLALVGESGSGKSTIAAATLGVLPDTAGLTGRVAVAGHDVGRADGWLPAKSRPAAVGYVPQDTGAALNPVVPVVDQVAEVHRVHHGLDRATARTAAASGLTAVGVDERVAARRLLPDELSGGMRQRALVAVALALDPALIVADEPTAALDPETALGVLDVLMGSRTAIGAATLLITHDLGVARAVADDIVVLYAGCVMELGPTREVLAAPRNPYTRGLIEAAPSVHHPERRPVAITGDPGLGAAGTTGCPFAPRCPIATDRCRAVRPEPIVVGSRRLSACHFAEDVTEAGRG